VGSDQVKLVGPASIKFSLILLLILAELQQVTPPTPLILTTQAVVQFEVHHNM